MTFVQQIIDDLISINVKSTTYPDWTDQAYAVGDIVGYKYGIYECIKDIANNSGLLPNEDFDSWTYMSTKNTHGAIDLRSTSLTTWDSATAITPADDSLIFEFTNTTDVTTVALGNIIGDFVTIEVYSEAPSLIHTETIHRVGRPSVVTWYNYYFDNFGSDESPLVLFEIPPVKGTAKVIVGTSDGTASAGYLIAGPSVWGGDSLFGFKSDIQTQAKSGTNKHGITVIERFSLSEKMNVDVIFPSAEMYRIKTAVREMVGDVALFIGDEEVSSIYKKLSLIGYCESFSVVTSNKTKSRASYSIKEIL